MEKSTCTGCAFPDVESDGCYWLFSTVYITNLFFQKYLLSVRGGQVVGSVPILMVLYSCFCVIMIPWTYRICHRISER